ncbi:hypothetical protein KIL84_003071 [Mauremys mutica]|uniref:Uncharacterized protein n=1 Tax=Mauremys mutica TaxID=74926 RepID=A0A9D3WUH1_9SAUR|nr:hypothetical protein KIL84_003071 [Mauremys mutica]
MRGCSVTGTYFWSSLVLRIQAEFLWLAPTGSLDRFEEQWGLSAQCPHLELPSPPCYSLVAPVFIWILGPVVPPTRLREGPLDTGGLTPTCLLEIPIRPPLLGPSPASTVECTWIT